MDGQNSPVVAKLALEDGTVFNGHAFGATQLSEPVTGEVVFNTSLTGYQEILTDPSYRGQIVTMTYPHIGNYGVNQGDEESGRIQAAGFIVKENANVASNYRSQQSLSAWLADQNILGLAGIDTRALTRKLRVDGAMRGALAAGGAAADDDVLIAAAQASPNMAGRNLAEVVSRREADGWEADLEDWRPALGRPDGPDSPVKVVAIDCGAKANILRNLVDRGCQVVVVPHDAPAEAILEHKPDGLFVSNGPGDPEPVHATIATLRQLQGKLPTFGICLGHQLLSLSLGAETYKMKFGHRGGNQPVQNLATGKVEITSQNHGFAVEVESLKKAGATPTHINLNDQTLEGFAHKDLPVFAVQYHPEASPGPHDASYLFDCFLQMIASGASPTAEQMDLAQSRQNAVS